MLSTMNCGVLQLTFVQFVINFKFYSEQETTIRRTTLIITILVVRLFRLSLNLFISLLLCF